MNTFERLKADGQALTERLRSTCAYSIELRSTAADVIEDSRRLFAVSDREMNRLLVFVASAKSYLQLCNGA